MDLIKVDKKLSKVYTRHPFLKNFPFSDFSLEAEELSVPSIDIEEIGSSGEKAIIVNFAYTRGKQRTLISVFDRELGWLNRRADAISKLDSIVKIVNRGLESSEITTKRDSVVATEKWIKGISDKHTALNYSTFNDILMRLVGTAQLRETVELINNINKLSAGAKVIRLDKKQYDIIMTYYDFQMIYCKLILGIIIAAKISL